MTISLTHPRSLNRGDDTIPHKTRLCPTSVAERLEARRARQERRILVVVTTFITWSLFIPPAFASNYEVALSKLNRTAYALIKVAYGCKLELGNARYLEARVAVENALRATGLPTNIALSSAAKIEAEAKAAATHAYSVSQCIMEYVEAKRVILHWRTRMEDASRSE
ncbi:hypothetical protein [Agrobacterium sp. SORGH_AS 787]|uniref:hypothetical protein n=1 Tax=Agrobacterium sp. SORGH_AS 787 TaxID=3041775 RepID=UPI00277EA289|nr:hypothetical protein [Rhizobium sp. SORGH_AS_0787]